MIPSQLEKIFKLLDLSNIPLPSLDWILFTDEVWVRDSQRNRKASYTVINPQEVLEAYPLKSAQEVELLAVIQTCKVAINLKVNIYTESKYAFGVCHAMEQMWRNRRKFLTAVVTEVSH